MKLAQSDLSKHQQGP